jgi:hypothetical protein
MRSFARSCDKLHGVIALGASILIPASCHGSTPTCARQRATGRCSSSSSGSSRSCVGLGWLGSAAGRYYVILARPLTTYYFVFFLIILPLLGIVEKTKRCK